MKECRAHLAGVFSQLFTTWSLQLCKIPTLWKSSAISPVPKQRHPTSPNDYWPIAITPIVMKWFEHVVVSRLLRQTQDHLDPMQFAYKRNRGTDDAILSLLHKTYSHLEKPHSFVRILFVDFSSAFNTIQPPCHAVCPFT